MLTKLTQTRISLEPEKVHCDQFGAWGKILAGAPFIGKGKEKCFNWLFQAGQTLAK